MSAMKIPQPQRETAQSNVTTACRKSLQDVDRRPVLILSTGWNCAFAIAHDIASFQQAARPGGGPLRCLFARGCAHPLGLKPGSETGTGRDETGTISDPVRFGALFPNPPPAPAV